MSDWKAGMSFDSILQNPLDFYDVTYANGHTVRYEKERPHGEWGKWVIIEVRCPECLEYFDTGCFSKEEMDKCPNCGADMRKDNEAKEKKPCPCDTCPTAIARCGCQMHLCSDYQKWKEGEADA